MLSRPPAPRSKPQPAMADRRPPGLSLLLAPQLGDRRRRSARIGANMRRVVDAAGQQARADGAYLVPLRLFIGLGWLRTGLEKATDPAWREGAGLAAFLHGQLALGSVVFPFYEILARRLFLPLAAELGWAIVLGECLVGTAILLGWCTRAALWGGLFLNLNFLLAGVANPSAFYIAIQVALLLANPGAILGVDGMRGREPRRGPPARRWPCWAVALLATATAAYAGAHVTDTSLAGSVHDPAVILTILAALALLWSLLALLRTAPARRG